MSWCTSIVQLHLVAGFKSESDTYFSPRMAHPLFYLPLLSVPLSRTVHLSQSQFWYAHKLTLAKVSKNKYRWRASLKRGKDPMMRQQKTLRLPTKRKLGLKKIPRVLLKLQVHCNRWFTFSKPTLYNMWRPAIQRSHKTFKTASPHGHQAPCIKRQTKQLILNFHWVICMEIC